jgi:4'-phosphopantetheinyl transferase
VSLEQPRGLLLSEDESERAARFYFERDRNRWSRARSALRFVVAKYVGTPPRELLFATGEYGKPLLLGSPIEFNLSHSGEWALIAVSQGAPVGVDLERIRENIDIARLLRRIGEMPPDAPPQELFRLWARREARTKAAGTPLMQAPSDDIAVCDLEAPPGYTAALAMVGVSPEPCYRGDV